MASITLKNTHDALNPPPRRAHPQEWRVTQSVVQTFQEYGQQCTANAGTFLSSITSKRKYTLIEVLGDGTSGLVLQLKKGGDYFALKIAKTSEKNSSLLQEADNSRLLNHLDPQHTLPLTRIFANIHFCNHPHCKKERLVGLLSPYGGPTLVTHFINPNTPPPCITQKDLLDLTQKSLLFLENMAKQGLTHGDLKPDNILLSKNTNKLSFIDNFSMGRVGETLQSVNIGTRGYTSPRLLTKKRSLSEGTFTVACTIYESITGRILFETPMNSERSVDDEYRLHLSQVFLFIPLTKDFLKEIPQETRVKFFANPTEPTTFKTLYAPDFLITSTEAFEKKFTTQLNQAISSGRIQLSIASETFKDSFREFLQECLNYNTPKHPTELLKHPFITQLKHLQM